MKEQHLVNKKIIFSFFGPPGSGKGTLAKKLETQAGFEVLSTGNLCRMHVSQKTELGLRLESCINQGKLIPDDLVSEMVREWLMEKVGTGKPIILDGFPRTSGQAAILYEIMTDIPGYDYRVVLVELAEDEIIKRLTQRRVCGNKDCQIPYNASYQEDTCEKCGSALVKRDDDKQEVILQRLKLYPAYRDTLLEYYEQEQQEIELFDVADMTPDQVFETFCAKI